MNATKIGYTGIGADGRPILANDYRTWSPGGMGCSNGCDGCYACKMSQRLRAQIQQCGTGEVAERDGLRYHVCRATGKDGKVRRWLVCEACANFEVHFHPERLDAPARAKKAKIVLGNFFADTFDKARPVGQIQDTLAAAARAPQHTYVWLTKQARIMAEQMGRPYDNWYCGLTLRTERDMIGHYNAWMAIPGNLWISYEPAVEAIGWEFALDCLDDQPRGIIIGHDNRKGAPGTGRLDHIIDCVRVCDAACVNWHVKQIWHEGRFLRANHPDEYKLFPPDLRDGARLPWSAPEDAS